jgi:hypothetical protein
MQLTGIMLYSEIAIKWYPPYYVTFILDDLSIEIDEQQNLNFYIFILPLFYIKWVILIKSSRYGDK